MNHIYILDCYGYKNWCPTVSVLNALLEKELITEEEYDIICYRIVNSDED